MADDWDLQAVVRGCTTNPPASCSTRNISIATNTAIISSTPTSAAATTYCNNHLSFVHQQDLYFRNGCEEELQELYKPFLPPPSPPLSPPAAIPISPLSVIGGLQDLSQQMQHLHQQPVKPRHNLSMSVPYKTKSSIISTNTSHNSRSKRRKTQMKRVIEIAAEALTSDMWSWRKYGQKPIKGSPYPRGYYKCSTSKGCLARKQVERKRSDPGMFIVTYNAEHNHPMPSHKNSLAGSSRHKPETSGEPRTNSCSSLPVSPSVSGSPELEKIEIEIYNDDIVEDEDGHIMNDPPEMKMDDEFFQGLEELEAVSGVSNSFSPNVKVQVPWLTNDITSKGEERFDF